AGTHTVTAAYAGNSSFQPSTSAALLQTVNPGPTGTPNQRFVTQVYLDLLNRQPEPGGLTFWTGQLDRGGSRTRVVQDIESSQEYKTDLVQSFYTLYLHRTGEPGGVTVWVNFLSGGGSATNLRPMFTSSTEYFQSRAGGQTSRFLDALYQDAFNRAVDAAGRAQFQPGLDSGRLNRLDVAEVVFGSAEFRQDLVQSFYRRFLRRNADPGG